MSCRSFSIPWVAVWLTTSACVSRTPGTAVEVVVRSTGIPDPVVDGDGRTWTVIEAWIDIADVTLFPCEASDRSRVVSPAGSTEPVRPVEPAPVLPSPEQPRPTPRHGGADAGSAAGRWVDLRTEGVVGRWTLSPPVASWCGVALGLQGPPSWGLHATGPWEVIASSARYVDLEVPMDGPLTLSADRMEATVAIDVDPLRWLGAIDDGDAADEALPALLQDAWVSR